MRVGTNGLRTSEVIWSWTAEYRIAPNTGPQMVPMPPTTGMSTIAIEMLKLNIVAGSRYC